jgi:hypothetical protein
VTKREEKEEIHRKRWRKRRCFNKKEEKEEHSPVRVYYS